MSVVVSQEEVLRELRDGNGHYALEVHTALWQSVSLEVSTVTIKCRLNDLVERGLVTVFKRGRGTYSHLGGNVYSITERGQEVLRSIGERH